MIADRRLHLTKDGRVVEEGDPEAFQLLVAEGCNIDDALALRHGIKFGGPDSPKPKAAGDEEAVARFLAREGQGKGRPKDEPGGATPDAAKDKPKDDAKAKPSK